MPWVRFHDEITKGDKRGIKRALRFVYMELSLAARPGRGKITLARGMKDLDAVHDAIGGDRREVAEALKLFTSGPTPSLAFETDDEGRRYLVVTAWARWNPNSDSSTERVSRHRLRADSSASIEQSRDDTAACNGGESATDTVSVTASIEDQSSETPVTRARGRASPSLSVSLSGISPEIPTGQIRGAAEAAASPPPPPSRPGERPVFSRAEEPYWRQAYEETVVEVLGTTWGFPDKQISGLRKAVETHCRNRAQTDGWIRDHVAAFVRAVRPKASVYSGFGPDGFLRWLNAGLPIEQDRPSGPISKGPRPAPPVEELQPPSWPADRRPPRPPGRPAGALAATGSTLRASEARSAPPGANAAESPAAAAGTASGGSR